MFFCSSFSVYSQNKVTGLLLLLSLLLVLVMVMVVVVVVLPLVCWPLLNITSLLQSVSTLVLVTQCRSSVQDGEIQQHV